MKNKITGRLVSEYKLGNTRIKIYDSAYAHKTKEDVDRILRRIESLGIRALYKQYSKEESEDKKVKGNHEE